MASRRPRFLRPGWILLALIALAAGATALWPRLRGGADVATGDAVAPGDTPAPVPDAATADSLPAPVLPAADDTLARPPAGPRIRVQVVNATTTRGLGRRATFYLRDRGWDVVEIGTAAARDRRDDTLVLDRSGHPEWARRVAHAMGGARVEARPDTSRYLDVTVLVGRAWRAPAEPFHP